MTTALQGAESDILTDDSELVPSHLITELEHAPGLRSGLEASAISAEDTYGTLDVDRTTKPMVKIVLSQDHPEDRPAIQQLIDRLTREVEDWNREHRFLRPAGIVKHLTAEIPARPDRRPGESLALRGAIDPTARFEGIVGTSRPLRTVLAHVAKVAPTDSTVLITGETGTGKELLARAIHTRSPRAPRPFVAVNCAAIPASLLASELFGHERGAFTGALQRRQGRFELADGGTLFLDEVAELPTETQIMLLRVLQEREFERVGGSAPVRVNVRVIAATNRDLHAAVADGTFRADLFYRLNVFPMHAPALRDRRADVPLLVEYFTHRFAARLGKRIRRLGNVTARLLQSYAWPGNIRELQNIIERAVIVCESDTLAIDPRWLSGRFFGPAPVASLSPGTLATHEKDAIEAALTHSQGRVAGPFGAASRLGVPASTLESKIKALQIDKRRFKPSEPPPKIATLRETFPSHSTERVLPSPPAVSTLSTFGRLPAPTPLE